MVKIKMYQKYVSALVDGSSSCSSTQSTMVFCAYGILSSAYGKPRYSLFITYAAKIMQQSYGR